MMLFVTRGSSSSFIGTLLGRAGEEKKEKRVTYFRKTLNYVFQNVNAIFFSTFFAIFLIGFANSIMHF